jgi:hypothetical protein
MLEVSGPIVRGVVNPQAPARMGLDWACPEGDSPVLVGIPPVRVG